MEQVLENEDWTLRVSRLLDLIKRSLEAIERHKAANSPDFIVEQYQHLRDEHLAELDELLQGSNMTIQLRNVGNAA
ncbi:hypothetical protein FHS57_000688 [Runella defluvii]|uniref:Uncharacterized protein n=1 Tax=Runella defluvii TaxID=370973 RepID=A0A7W5ZGE4_9BACT|nr:hypothetical protein [Runella defluvii]MBB3836706.1 hypothetical protein [Runella defluvii]